MEKLLQQEEIDALVEAARGGAVQSPSDIARWDYRQIGRMGREQLDAITGLHEGFARSLTNSIGAYLRIGFQAGLASAEHLSYRELLGAVPERSYLGSVKLTPIGASALIQMDMAIAFPLIDVLLGGEGVGQPPSREITQIEEHILETVMRIICRELQLVWQPLGLEFQFEQRQQPGRVQHLLPPEEKTLGLSFEVTMKDSRGLLGIAIPAVVSTALLRKISASRPRSQGQLRSADLEDRLRKRLLSCRFRFDMELGLAVSSAKELAELKPGSVLVFEGRADRNAQLMCAGRPIFQARIVRRGNLRAAQLVTTIKDKHPEAEYDV